MAFNPFNVFRRNQKTLFAILTVFIMIMFTVSFGQGDITQRVQQWLGARGDRGDPVAVVDGSRWYERDMHHTRESRVVANEFMVRATQVASSNMENSLRSNQGGAGQTAKEAIDNLLRWRQGLMGGGDPRMTQFVERLYLQAGQQIDDLVAKEGTSKDDLDLARNGQHLMDLDRRMADLRSGGYFIAQPNRSVKDTFDFTLWLKKADKFGITISADDARDLVSREFFNKFSAADFKELEDTLLKNKAGTFTKDRLYAALADEFKVRAAINAVMGQLTARTTTPGVQAVTAPIEGYQFFREQSAAATYGVIAVPVQNYLDKVPGEPTATEKQELFSKYRNVEPDPTKESPGLKEPRKLKFEFLELRGDVSYYKTAAADRLAKGELQAKLGLLLNAPMGPSLLVNAAAVAPALVPDLALANAYDGYKQGFKRQVDTNMFPSAFIGVNRVIDTDVVKAANLAGTAGAAAGAALTFGSPLTIPLMFEQRAAVEDRNLRARIQASFLANPAVPGAGSASVFGATAAAIARMPDPLPLAVMRNELGDSVRKDVARRTAEADLREFQIELAKLGADKDKSKVTAYLDKFVKDRGLTLGKSMAWQSMFTVESDPGIAPIKARLEKLLIGQSVPPHQLGRFLFSEPDPRRESGRMVASSFYKPEAFPQLAIVEGETNFLIWRTEEVKADAPKTMLAAEGKIVAAWKELKARELARAAAEDLAKKAGALSQVPGTLNQQLRDEHAKFIGAFPEASKERARYFLLNDVAPLPAKPFSPFSPARQETQTFSLAASADVPYPTQGMVEALIKNKDKPFATTVVEPDAGRGVYYVMTVIDRKELLPKDYYDMVYASLDPTFAQAVNSRQRIEAFRQSREQALALLRAEFKVEKENAAKLSEKAEAAE